MIKRTTAVVGLTVLSVALAACGESTDPSSAADDDPLPPASERGLLAPRPVRTSGDPGTARDPGADRGATEAATADVATGDLSMLAPWSSLSFRFAPDLVLPTVDVGYVFGPTAAPDPDRIVALARALGVEGELTLVDAAEGGGWRVGPGDGTAPSLQVAATGQLDWWYTPAWSTDEAVEPADDCMVAFEEMASEATTGEAATDTVSSEGSSGESSGESSEEVAPDPGDQPEPVVETPPCEIVEVAPPTGVPSADEARALADSLAAAAGLDLAGQTAEVWADEWSAHVSYLPDAANQPPSYLSFGFGGEGALQWASGSLGVADAAGPYPLVDLDTATGRVEELYAFDASEVFGDGVDPALVDPIEGAPGEPMEPVDRVVEVVSVAPALWAAWDTDGSIWYVPAYEFVAADESTWIVPAVTDEYLIVEDAVAEEPVAEEPAVEEPVEPTEEPVEPVEESAEPVDGSGEEVMPPDDKGGEDVAALEAAAPSLVGLTEDEATVAASDAGWGFRVVERDGEPQAITMDLRMDRVNVVVFDGIVTAIASVG